jgi:MFS family permease
VNDAARPAMYYGWWIVVAGLAINFATATANPLVFSFMIGPMSDDLGVGKSALALALTFRLVAAGASAPVLGMLLDRHGGRYIGAVCGLLAGVGLIALAFVHSLWLVYAVFAVTGIAGFGAPSGQLLTVVPVARWFVAKRARALAIVTTGMAGGTVALVPITQGLISGVGWRGTSAIYGVLILAIVVPVSLLLVRRAPEDLGLHPDGAKEAPRLATGHAAGEADWTVSEALRTPSLWFLMLALTVGSLTLTATVVHRVDYWDGLGMSSGLIGLGTAIDPLVVLFSAFAFGLVAERIAIRVVGFIGFVGLSFSILPVILSNGEAWTIIAHGGIWGLAVGGYITLNNMVWPTYFGSRFAGSIRGIVLPSTVAASAAGPPIFGLLFDAGVNPDYVWALSVGGFAIASVLAVLARPPRRQPRMVPVLVEERA